MDGDCYLSGGVFLFCITRRLSRPHDSRTLLIALHHRRNTARGEFIYALPGEQQFTILQDGQIPASAHAAMVAKLARLNPTVFKLDAPDLLARARLPDRPRSGATQSGLFY